MGLLLRLLRDTGLALVGSALLGAFVTRGVDALGAEHVSSLRLAFTWAVPVELALVAAAAWVYTLRFRRALARASSLTREEAVAAAVSAHRLPIRMGLTVLGVASAAVLAVSWPALDGDAPDLAWAGIGVGVATALLAAMLSYSASASGIAGEIEGLGPAAETSLRGSVRFKILVVCVGVFCVALLLVGPTGYARYRADTDRDLVGAALTAQEAAAQAVGEDGRGAETPPALQAQAVYGVSHFPTAVLGARGEVLARAGAEGRAGARTVAFTGALGAGTLKRVRGGWLVSTRTPGGRTLVSMVDESLLWRRRREFVGGMAETGVAVFLAAALLAWFAARSITHPFRTLGRAADRIAEGDLTASPPSLTRDEMGLIATDFRRMAGGLRTLLRDVRAANEEVALGAREGQAIAERVRDGALEQHATVVAVDGAVEAMEGSMGQVTRGIDALHAFLEQTTGLASETAAAIEEVRRKGVELERAVATTLSDVSRLSSAGREAEQQLFELESLATDAGSGLSSVRSSATAVEQSAGQGEANVEAVARLSEHASGVVLETVHGIETLRAAVGDAHRRISVLGRRSDDIEQVVDFIAEVAGRTNLLSLNASIIASQAGEHGKAFAVVADQIRELAAQISRSTKSIGDIVHSVREEVEATTALIDRGDALAGEGVQLARNSYEALTLIQRSATEGRDAAGGMRRAAEAHANATRDVARLVQSIADGSRAVTSAVQMVGRSVAGVETVARSVGAMSGELGRALDGQASGAGRQLENAGRLEALIADTIRAAKDHSTANHRVRASLRSLSARAGEHEAAVVGLFAVAEQLGREARILQERMARFKLG
ncbi:MAG TPA: methyl-accepting chemotaxis protein [Anaeromyxobacteraceae bacterium]|nr:methyl-accepting chemotaxis protein [Anaeromyxobacteraceae bacterium]